MKIDYTEITKFIKNLPLEKTSPPKASCPKPKKLISLLRNELSDRKKSKVIDHLEHCTTCVNEIKFINEILTEEKNFNKKTAHIVSGTINGSTKKGIFNRVPFPQLSWISKGVVALLTTIILSASGLFLLKTNKPAIERTTSFQVSHLSPNNSSINLTEEFFTWDSIPDSEYSIVEISDDSATPVWKSGKILSNTLNPSKDLIQMLKKEATYLWMVTTYLKSGKQIESPVTKFSVK